MSEPAQTKNLWAPVITPKRGKPWICYVDARSTRRESKAAYLKDVLPAYHSDFLERCRFAKVTITEQKP